MDSPFKNGDPPNLGDDEHWYQIGETPVYLRIAKEQGKCRLSFVVTATPSGAKLTPAEIVHLATFVGDGQAIAVAEFLDTMVAQITSAIEYHETEANKYEKVTAAQKYLDKLRSLNPDHLTKESDAHVN